MKYKRINNFYKNSAKEFACNLGFEGEKTRGNCCQATYNAISSTLGTKNPIIFKSLSVLSGGILSTGIGVCGAFIGSIVVISYFFGRTYEEWETKIINNKANEISKNFYDIFVKDNNSILCNKILEKKLGKSFNFNDQKELNEYINLGGPLICSRIVGLSAKTVVEILWEFLPKDIIISEKTSL
jgi:C_GCAxxG_C_C family probable redox protein